MNWNVKQPNNKHCRALRNNSSPLVLFSVMSIADETKEAHEGHRLMRTGNTLKAVDWYRAGGGTPGHDPLA
jgi:hypothetical protein